MSGRASQSGDAGSADAEEEFDGSGARYRRITGQCSYGINQGYVLLLCILSRSLPMYFGSACLPPPTFARARPPADSKSSKLRADIDRCLVCIPRALMANGEGTKKKDEERERAEKFPSLAPLRRLQNAPPPQPQLDCNRRPRVAARRCALARRQRRQTCRISKFLSGSSTFRKQRGGRAGGSNCLGKQARASDRDPLSSSAAASTST